MTAEPTTHAAAPDRPMPGRRELLLPLAAAGVTVLLWASAFVGIRAVADVLSPGPLALGRLLVGSVVLGAFVLARGERLPARGDLLRAGGVGVLWFGAYNVALNAGEQRVDAGTAAMLVNIGPILIAVMAGLLLGEGFPRRLFVGSLLGFTGVVVIALATARGTGADVWGVVLCAVAAVTYASAVILQKPVLARVSALQVTWLACTVGALVCLPFAPALVREVGDGPASSVGWIVYLGAFPTALAFTTWAYALARTSAGKLGATTYLVPAVAVVMAWVLLDEVPPALALAGGALSLAGVAVTRMRSRRRVRR